MQSNGNIILGNWHAPRGLPSDFRVEALQSVQLCTVGKPFCRSDQPFSAVTMRDVTLLLWNELIITSLAEEFAYQRCSAVDTSDYEKMALAL